MSCSKRSAREWFDKYTRFSAFGLYTGANPHSLTSPPFGFGTLEFTPNPILRGAMDKALTVRKSRYEERVKEQARFDEDISQVAWEAYLD